MCVVYCRAIDTVACCDLSAYVSGHFRILNGPNQGTATKNFKPQNNNFLQNNINNNNNNS